MAVLKAGAAYLPLDPRNPAERLRDSSPSRAPAVLLADPALPRRPAAESTLPGRAADDERSPAGRLPPPPAAWRPPTLAYVMYTSGSTGRPRASPSPTRNVLDLVADGRVRPTAHERVLLHSPHAFDASTYELWVPLLTGRQRWSSRRPASCARRRSAPHRSASADVTRAAG